MKTVEVYMRLPWTIVVRFHDETGGDWSATSTGATAQLNWP